MGQGQWGHHTLRSISDPVCPSLFVFVANERCYSLIFSAIKRCTATGRRMQENDILPEFMGHNFLSVLNRF